MKKRQTLIYIVSAVLSVALLAYLLLNLDWEILRVAFADIRWGWLGLALLAYLINIFLRALRFTNLIYSRPVKWAELVPVSALHNILMYLMPAKTGDVTYIFIAKDRLDLSLTEGTATLFAARFYDFSVVAAFLMILLPFSKNEIPDWIFIPAIIFCGLILLGALGILAFLKFSQASGVAQLAVPTPEACCFWTPEESVRRGTSSSSACVKFNSMAHTGKLPCSRLEFGSAFIPIFTLRPRAWDCPSRSITSPSSRW